MVPATERKVDYINAVVRNSLCKKIRFLFLRLEFFHFNMTVRCKVFIQHSCADILLKCEVNRKRNKRRKITNRENKVG